MRLTPRRATLTLLAATGFGLPAGATAADQNVYCVTVPPVWVLGDVTTQQSEPCIPWP